MLSLHPSPAFPPMPVPPAGFAGLTPEELQALEGHERQHLEARLQSLRNIHTLLDAAMLQINQYLTVLASLGYVCQGTRAGSRGVPLPGGGSQQWFSAFFSPASLLPAGAGHLSEGTSWPRALGAFGSSLCGRPVWMSRSEGY